MNFISISNHAIIFFLAMISVKFKSSLSKNLNNEKSDRVLFSLKTPIWFTEGSEFNYQVKYTQVDPRSLHDAINFYENFENMAGIDIEKDNRNNWHFTRHIDKSNNSRKIPENLREIWLELFGGLHNNFTHFKNMKNSKNVKRSTIKSHSTDSTRRVKYVLPVYDGPDPIYPRILLFVDFKDYYYTTDRDVRFYQLLIYLIAFWNAVDLEYTEFEFPLIKFHIAGIVVGNNKWANPLLYTNSQFESQSAKYNEAWNNFRNYLIHNDPLPELWDIPISQSGVELYFKVDSIYGNVGRINGLAPIGRACNFSPKSSRKDSAVLVIDNYLFNGILSATHEIGHIFGANHDGSPEALCDDYQFAMTPTSADNLSSVETWSWCSKFVILKQLRNNSKVCWNFAPSIDKINQVPEILPGHLVSLKNQCINRGYDDICDEQLIKCNGLYCKHKLLGLDVFKDCEYAGPSLAGSYCDNDKHCINKNCFFYV